MWAWGWLLETVIKSGTIVSANITDIEHSLQSYFISPINFSFSFYIILQVLIFIFILL